MWRPPARCYRGAALRNYDVASNELAPDGAAGSIKFGVKVTIGEPVQLFVLNITTFEPVLFVNGVFAEIASETQELAAGLLIVWAPLFALV
jgi:hypothetical protein